MDKNVLIDISTRTTDTDGISEFEMSIVGKYQKKNNDYIIEYIEQGMDSTKTTITFGKGVNILRQGAYFSNIRIERGKRWQSLYHTPYGEATVATTADEIDYKLDDDGGKATLKYALDIDGQLASFYEMDINVAPVG
ncbi:hypothetical protein FACS1894132_04140 [Clostridia bacterium]|nr:hypothetical protein FACS1894132_04140 [Clostridia bacterium]